jgi:hypothetical protein
LPEYHKNADYAPNKTGKPVFNRQNLNLHGIIGTPLSAIVTAGEFVGFDYLINKINNHQIKNMKFKLIYPKWQKLEGQTTFTLPPHGPVVMAASLPDYIDVSFTDENVEAIDFDEACDFVGISMMLSTQVKRGWEIAAEYRKRGKKVIFGGISAMLHAEETMLHADSVFLGESEGRMEEVFTDFKNNCLKKVYNYLNVNPDINLVGPAAAIYINVNYTITKGYRWSICSTLHADAVLVVIPVQLLI